MPSQFFGLNIGYTGLQAANAALNVTGNNIANVETKGYTRQVAVQQAANALRTNTSYGMAGAGVDTTSINQVRENYYDLKYWSNNSDLGIYEIKEQYYKQIEDYFTDTDDTMGFNVIFSDLFDSLDEVYKSGGDDTKKSAFLSECTTLCEYFNSMSNNLKKLQTDANNEIQNKVNEVNSIASELATLNKQINAIEINGATANELRDKRALLIDELSKVVDVEVQEIPIPITENSDEYSGIYRYVVNIAGGQNLVNGYDYSQLTCVARDESEKINQSDADGLYNIYINEIALNLYGGNLGGELKGLLEIRDGNNGEYFEAAKEKVNIADSTTVEITIDKTNPNCEFLTDMNKSTLNPSGTITIGNKDFTYDSWEYEYDETAEEGYYTFHLSTSPAQEDATKYAGKEVKVGVGVDYQGIPYYQAQLNEWVRSFAQVMNKIELGAQDTNGNQTEVLFSSGTDNYKFDDYYVKDASGNYVKDAEGNVTIKAKTVSTENNYQQLTAENFRVNSYVLSDIGRFGTTNDITKGQDAQDITEKLLQVKDDKDKMSFRGCSASEFLQCITADVALGASSANSFSSNYSKISSAIIAQRTSVSGVDNDEEALNLVKFQEAYNLASKMIQVMTEIYDRLILNTGV